MIKASSVDAMQAWFDTGFRRLSEALREEGMPMSLKNLYEVESHLNVILLRLKAKAAKDEE